MIGAPRIRMESPSLSIPTLSKFNSPTPLYNIHLKKRDRQLIVLS